MYNYLRKMIRLVPLPLKAMAGGFYLNESCKYNKLLALYVAAALPG